MNLLQKTTKLMDIAVYIIVIYISIVFGVILTGFAYFIFIKWQII